MGSIATKQPILVRAYHKHKHIERIKLSQYEISRMLDYNKYSVMHNFKSTDKIDQIGTNKI